ncbi:MAG: hypothetical protein J2P57_02360 [Acidimicrobiaceae bacterium]|nr:hypothetical protein [Acidimicrobiaceae bacterium]
MSRVALAVLVSVLALTLPAVAWAGDSTGSSKTSLAPTTSQASKPVAPTLHDVTKPWVMDADAAVVGRHASGSLKPRKAVSPLRPRTATSGVQVAAAPAAAPSTSREVFGFVNAGGLGDPNVGYATWNFSLLSTVAYFGLTVNSDGSLLQGDTGWDVWHSSIASGLLNTAHSNGVRVVISLIAHNQSDLCSTLSSSSIQTTVSQTASQLLGADGVNIDYEGTNSTCPDGVTLRTKMDQLAQAFRAASLGYLSIDTYASSAEDSGGFFDVPTLAASVDSMFVMDYGLETSNGPCSTCMGATSPLANDAQNAYPWNVTRSANDYLPWAAQTILGFPYYGVKGCVNGPNPPANAPLATPSQYGADAYVTIQTYASDPNIQNWSGVQRDGLDPSGVEPWATFYSTYASCWREEYWDDPISLGNKYDLVNQDNFRGAGIFTLDYGGGSPELWNELASRFSAIPAWSSLGGSLGSGPSVSSWASDRMDSFVADSGTGAVLHKWWVGGQWSGFENLGGAVGSGTDPAAVSWGPNRIDVFVDGTDGQLWHRWFAGGWSGWEPLGGILTSSPTVASWASGRLDVFVRGIDGAIWHKWYAGGWSDWESQGGVSNSAPGAASWGPNRIDLFVRGTDNGLWHRWWDGAQWQGWEPLGGTLTSAPAASSWGAGRIDLVVLATGGTPCHISYVAGWSGCSPLGDTGSADPAVVDLNIGTIYAFMRGNDGTLWYSPVRP